MVRKLGVLALTCLLLCAACATHHQIPQTEHQLQRTVTTAESAYMALYTEHKANRLTPSAMANVDVLYASWRRTQALLIDAVRAGAIEWAPE
jgi:hypothetical protein